MAFEKVSRNFLGIGLALAGVIFIFQELKNKNETKEAHVSPSQEQFVARNYGTVERVSTERNILGGQAVGQTLNYNGMGITPAGLQASNGIGQVLDLNVFAATMRSTDPIWGQNYPGRAIGQE